MNVHQIKLKKGKELSLKRNHPWVFSGAIHGLPKSLLDGDIVDVYSFENNYLATGHYQGGGSIAVRVISFEKKEIDQKFWNDKLANAHAFRKHLNLIPPDTTAYRLIHGEGDGIPGLIIDIYNEIAVIQCHSVGVHLAADMIAKALLVPYEDSIDSIYLRCRDTLPEQYGSTVSDGFIRGKKEETTVSENGKKFKINVITGQKTGFFLDQRNNRQLVGSYSEGKTVLNCFCYTGGFSVYALCNGADSVDSVDISQKAVDMMEENVNLNTFAGIHRSFCANVMHFLNDPEISRYDIVVVDPPAFAKSLHKRHNAVQAYKRLNVLALKKVKNCGFLFTFSCSQVVGTQLFYDTIVAAGIEANKNIRVVQSLSQGPDHPINLFHPEGHYLKGLLLYVED